jgi:hypothetical protein
MDEPRVPSESEPVQEVVERRLASQEEARAQNDEAEHLGWLVKRRSDVQFDLLQLFKLARSQHSEVADNPPELWITHFMIGAEFSLWRAVFLGNVSLSANAIAQHTERFLKTLIEDNAIGYPQDRNAREWAFGYYVNNAALRIAEMARRNQLFADLLTQQNIIAVRLMAMLVAETADLT